MLNTDTINYDEEIIRYYGKDNLGQIDEPDCEPIEPYDIWKEENI